MRPNHYSTKIRQLKVLAERLQRHFIAYRVEDNAKIEKLIQKITGLVQELKQVISRVYLKKLLGAAAVLIGISFPDKGNSQSFAAPVQNPFGLVSTNYLAFPAFADLDGDGDTDLLVGEYYGALKYFQNTGTAISPQFAAPLVNPFGLVGVANHAIPAFADLDDDGDLDLLVGEYYGTMKYFENTGSVSAPQFAAPLLNPFGLVSTNLLAAPAFADLDNDGDMDLLVGETYGIMQYFENTGSVSAPQFAAPVGNPFGIEPTYYLAFPAFADLDNDGDIDLLAGEDYGTTKYYQNAGSDMLPQFNPPLTNAFGLVPTSYNAFPAFADLDGDSDLDLLVGENYGVMQYFQNLDVTGISDVPQPFALTAFPNPTSGLVEVSWADKKSIADVFTTVGEKVFSTVDFDTEHVIDLSSQPAGIYFLKLISEDRQETVVKIIRLSSD